VHGWACAEAIHAIAPDAELHLVRNNSFTMYEDAVAWAIREQIDVISMSMSFYNDSLYDGTGPHDPLIRALHDAGITMVKSAGNDGALHWSGPYVDADHDGRLDGDGDNAVMLYLERPVGMYLTWNQFGDACGDTDLDLVVVGPNGDVLATSDQRQPPEGDEACRPFDVAVPPVVDAPDWYRFEVRLRRGASVGLTVNLIARGGTLLNPMPEGSVSDPASHPLVAAVGAVRATAYWNGPPEGFSSRGPTVMGLPKPDITGPDGLSGVTYGPVGFYGTSASTPAVAGLVALVMQDDPSLSSAEAFARLQGWAHPPSPTDADGPGAYGAGLARLPDRDDDRLPCGQRPLVLGLLWLPGASLLRAAGLRSRR
ncbi:MAG: S8 family serine peptidase, partial [Myxococcota bacterium]